MRALAADLFTHQLGLWGCDVQSATGNLLVEQGFTRTPPPVGSRVPSLYRLDLGVDAHVVLRGFGVFYGRRGVGGVFLRRDSFLPRFTSAAAPERLLWEAEDLPTFLAARSREAHDRYELLIELIEWIASYESRVLVDQGIDYRRRVHDAVVARRDKRSRLPLEAKSIAETWRRLGALAIREPNLFLRSDVMLARAAARRLARRSLADDVLASE